MEQVLDGVSPCSMFHILAGVVTLHRVRRVRRVKTRKPKPVDKLVTLLSTLSLGPLASCMDGFVAKDIPLTCCILKRDKLALVA